MFPVTYRKPANFKKVLKILAEMGYIIMSGVKPPRRDRLHIASVPRFEPGARGTYHAVISKNGKVVWDPAAKGKMKKGSYLYRIDSYFWIESIGNRNVKK
jgi:hypothetical protein